MTEFQALVVDIYRQHRDRLCRLVARRFREGIEAEDAVQEAFARTWALNDGGIIAPPVALITRILLNLASDGYRRHVYCAQYLDHDRNGAEEAATGADPETMAADRQRYRLLLTAIENLPPRCREVFILSRFDGLSHPEIATRLGISRNMVEKHIIRALTELRDLRRHED